MRVSAYNKIITKGIVFESRNHLIVSHVKSNGSVSQERYL